MAKLDPPEDDLKTLPEPREPGEVQLLNAFREMLGDDPNDGYTIYVQPHLNGVKPDLVAAHPHRAVLIVEVKDWNLDIYTFVHDGGMPTWTVRTTNNGSQDRTDDCPFARVDRYKKEATRFEISAAGAMFAFDKDMYGAFVQVVCFAESSKSSALGVTIKNWASQHAAHKHTVVLFKEDIKNGNALRRALQEGQARYFLRDNNRFARWSEDTNLERMLHAALAHPKYDESDAGLKRWNAPLSKRQSELLKNEGFGRARGEAGSGKSFLIARKAADAAREGKQVLVVCYNITMANILADWVKKACHRYGVHVYRHVTIRHIHRMFGWPLPKADSRAAEDVVNNLEIPAEYQGMDVVLVDEGQDFLRCWILAVQRCLRGTDQDHFFLMEDERQNIYGRQAGTKRRVPRVPPGPPKRLDGSHRLAPRIAAFAEVVVRTAQIGELNDLDLKSLKTNPDMFASVTWRRFRDVAMLNSELLDAVMKLPESRTPWPDVAILVPSIEHGRLLRQMVEARKIPVNCTFESATEYDALVTAARGESRGNHTASPDCKCCECVLKQKLDDVRRHYKMRFWMQHGGLKLATIHSFKGWEIHNVLVAFGGQAERDGEVAPGDVSRSLPYLFYTAATRAMSHLHIYDSERELDEIAAAVGGLSLPSVSVERE